MGCRQLVLAGCVVAALTPIAASAHAAAPGWSTPHTVTAYKVGTYGAGPNGQAVQLFGNGGAQTRTAQLRAIKSDATQGTAVGVPAGVPGFDVPEVAVNPSGRLIAAWTLDTQGTGPIGLAGTLGARTSLPKTATVLPTDRQSVSDLATAIDAAGNGLIAWIEGASSGGASTVKAATLRSGQAPQVAVVDTRTSGSLEDISLGLDSAGRPTVTWSVGPSGGAGTLIAVARGDGTGGFAPAVEQQITTAAMSTLRTFVTTDGALLAFWVEGALPAGPLDVKSAQAPAGAAFGAARTLISGTPARGQVRFAANAAGRAAVVFPVASGGGTSLRVLLRTSSGTWGSARTLGPSGRSITQTNIGVDAKGRVVALWDDGSSSSSGATRVLAARSSSSTDPLGSYNQVSQRSGDKRCDQPVLSLSTSGDGLGLWQCNSSSSGAIDSPRLARLTKAS